jgi:hypothetical protein
MRSPSFLFLALLALLALVAPVAYAPGLLNGGEQEKVPPDHAAKMAKGTELFKARVREVLQTKCLKCHSGERLEGELDINTREALLKGGARGPAVVSGDHAKSLLTSSRRTSKSRTCPKAGGSSPTPT